MQAKTENVRTPVSMKVLWKWTGVSALIHAGIIAVLCGFSYMGFKQREAAAKEKEASQEALVKAKEAEEAAKASNAPAAPVAAANPAAPAQGTPAAPAAPGTPAAPAPAPAAPPVDPVKKAESILGIDKVAKPDEIPKSPFATKGDDLLKDLK